MLKWTWFQRVSETQTIWPSIAVGLNRFEERGALVHQVGKGQIVKKNV